MRLGYLPATAAILLGSAVSLSAEYVLVLKNGRQITVQSYREEGSMIKFPGFGGEIGISRDQIRTINQLETNEPGGLSVIVPERLQGKEAETRETAAPKPSTTEKSADSEDDRESEAREFQQKLSETNQRLKDAQDRYSQAIRETSSPQPSQLVSPAQVGARQDDIVSRFKDAQHNPSEPAPVRLLEPSPFTSLPPTITEIQPTGRVRPAYEPPPAYTERQQELLDLRNQIIQIDKEREQLLNEIRQKNFNSLKPLE